MSYYSPGSHVVYDPRSKSPHKLSRSKISNFLDCARCFFLDQRLGVGTPPSYPYTLNIAVDSLLKKEFDRYRASGAPHPLMKAAGIDALLFSHPDMAKWRNSKIGVSYLHAPTNTVIYGAIDDLWVKKDGELILVEFKSTAKNKEVGIDAGWQIAYKRQMEIYQWLFRQNGFSVSQTGYFVYCNGNVLKEEFNSILEFSIKLIPYRGDDTWINGAIENMHKCLNSQTLPPMGKDCDFCKYRKALHEKRREFQNTKIVNTD